MEAWVFGQPSSFLLGTSKNQKASDFSVVKANVHLEKIYEKLTDLKETGNNFAEILLNKLQDLTVKNLGLTTAARMARGEGVSEPQQLTIYSFDRCTSVSVESFSSILLSFFQERSNITGATMLKLLFVQYNTFLKLRMIFIEYLAFFSP